MRHRQDFIDQRNAVLFFRNNVHGIKSTAHEHRHDQRNGNKDILIARHHIWALQYLHTSLCRPFPLLVKNRERVGCLLKHIQFIAGKDRLDAAVSHFHTDQVC